MRTKLYYDMRNIDDASFDFASMRKLTRPSSAPGRVTRIRRPANDNSTLGKVTRMVAHNGGCSTTSGRVPVSVQRVSMIDGQVAA